MPLLDMVRLLAETHGLLLAFSALVFDIPRYTFSLLWLALFGARGLGEERTARGSIGR